MDAKDIFFTEQIYVSRVMKMLMDEGKNIEKGKDPNLNFWLFFEKFMREFVDKHYMKKAEHLLKALLQKGISKEEKDRIIGILCEHEMSGHYITKLGEIFNKDFGNNKKTIEGLKKVLQVFKIAFKGSPEKQTVKIYEYTEKYFDEEDYRDFRDQFLKANEQMDYVGYAKNILNLEKHYSSDYQMQ